MPDTPRRSGSRFHGIILAFDFGLRRIGIAAGNSVTQSATALTTVNMRAGQPPWSEIDRIIAEWSPTLLVVGQPDARSSGALSRHATAFSDALAKRYGLPVERVDEAFTSTSARSEVREARRAGYRRRPVGKAMIDSHAARLIAEQFLQTG